MQCLNGWSKCPGIEYDDWRRVVDAAEDQNRVWRDHEFHARRNEREYRERIEFGLFDFGGEA